MKIFLIGEAGEHRDDLLPHLNVAAEVISLPWSAADTTTFDSKIADDDIVVSLRFSRPAGAPRFRMLHVPGAGLDQIHIGELSPETVVCNVFEHEGPIGEFVVARLLEWEIRAGELQHGFGADAWPQMYRNRRPHGELADKTLLLVGYGRIGRSIAARAHAFGVNVIAVDDSAVSDDHASVLPINQLDRLQQQTDYLVLACPLTPDTEGLIDEHALERLPAHAVLVNVSRAPIVSEVALYAALRDNQIGGAILDVWYRYPTPENPEIPPAGVPLWELPNAWCTPHSSAWTTELPRRRYAVIADNINRLTEGQPLRNVVRAAGDNAQRGARK
ncbi:2-hydroxyacid dehydrogenase [Mycobacterium sp. 21AC1]|uniref:2-hydroxyacid dehydrogenase n=1 Tax=[Mycobacterium] appelbergii TaxID=2939269 RepID=UPI002938DAF2|nr:2-hydroxyacid dehydrogenase [Mycobacterium sp. 21AC1]MDV3127536.1 2-hydroxyacid dehydrogenase [Mycobacterium sp. 21AC1]